MPGGEGIHAMTAAGGNDDRLRSALTSLDDLMGNGADCPTAERIWKSATGGLSPTDDRTVISHLGDCGSCSSAWSIARELARDEELPEVAAPPTGSIWRHWVPMAVAASIVMVVISVGVLQIGEPEDREPVYREQVNDWLEEIMPADPALSRESCTLRWAPGPEGTVYDLLVMDDRLQPLTRARMLEVPEYTVATVDLESVQAGGNILWRVTAHLPDGRRAVSRTFTTRVE